jgi:hypothetical protein
MSNNIFILCLVMFSLGLTSFYSIRFRLVTIWSSQSSAPLINTDEHIKIIIPIILLATLSICTGRIISWLPPVSQSIFILPILIKLIPLFIVSIGLLTAWYISSLTSTTKSLISLIPLSHYGSCLMWYLVPLSSQFIIKFPLFISHHFIKSTDQGWLEIASGNGLHTILSSYNNPILQFRPKSPTSYLSTATIASIFLISIIILYSLCLDSLIKAHHWSWLYGVLPL